MALPLGVLFGSLMLINPVAAKQPKLLEVVDCAGRTVRLKGPAKRIVDLTFAEGSRTLVALKAEHLLVGVSDTVHQIIRQTDLMSHVYAVLPVVAPELAQLPNVGSPKEPNIEKVLALQPDVVLVAWAHKSYADILQKQIGVPVICIGGFGSFNFEVFDVAGKITGTRDRARQLIQFAQGKIGQISAAMEGMPENRRKRVFYWVRPIVGSPMTNGRYEAFEAAGAVNVASMGEKTPYGVFKVTREQILAWNPDMIFKQSTFTRNVPGWHTLASIRLDPVIRHVTAVKSDAVFRVRGHLSGWDIATETVEVLYIAKIIYPERFAHLDVAREGDDILKVFYGKPGVFSEMCRATKLHCRK